MKCGDDVEAVAARVILFEAAVDEIHDDENEKRNVRPDTEISPKRFQQRKVTDGLSALSGFRTVTVLVYFAAWRLAQTVVWPSAIYFRFRSHSIEDACRHVCLKARDGNFVDSLA